MALLDQIAPFLWGQGGQAVTPEQVARQREIAQALLTTDTSPVGHWTQGLARVADAAVGAFGNYRASENEKAGRAGFQSQWDEVFGSGQTASIDPVAAALTGVSTAGGDFLSNLVNSESGGNWQALNDEGYGGRLQFGQDRLADAAAAGVIPAGMTGADFSMMSPEVQQAVEQWHFGDIDQQAANMGLNQYFGQTIGGVPINAESIRAMAHLGGIGGAQKFITSGGQYNPADSNGTRLSDYGTRFGGAVPTQVAQAGGMGSPDIAALLGLASDPWANDTQRSIINALVGQQLEQQAQANDPLRQLQIERAQMENDAMRNPAPALPSFDYEGGQWWQQNPDGSAPFAVTDPAADVPDSVEALDLRAQRAGLVPGTPEYNDFMIKGGGGPMVNINNMPETAVNDFFSNLGAQETANYKTILENGPKAARTLAQLDQLEGLLAASPQGFEAAATAFAGNFGIDLGNASGVQAAQALINQLVPAQRPPGSGPMSDADLELFKQSVPRLINQPGGNQIIMDTMRQINMYDQALANIVQEATWRGEMAGTPEEKMQIRREMRDQIAALQNPLEQFGKRIEGYERAADEQSGTGTTSTGLKWSIVP